MRTALFALMCASAFTGGFVWTTSMIDVHAIERVSPHPQRVDTSTPHRASVETPRMTRPKFRADAGTPIKLAGPTMHCNAARLLTNSAWQHVQECNVY